MGKEPSRQKSEYKGLEGTESLTHSRGREASESRRKSDRRGAKTRESVQGSTLIAVGKHRGLHSQFDHTCSRFLLGLPLQVLSFLLSNFGLINFII